MRMNSKYLFSALYGTVSSYGATPTMRGVAQLDKARCTR